MFFTSVLIRTQSSHSEQEGEKQEHKLISLPVMNN